MRFDVGNPLDFIKTNLNSFNRPTGSSLVVTTSDAQSPPGDDCPPGGDEGPGGGGLPIGTC